MHLIYDPTNHNVHPKNPNEEWNFRLCAIKSIFHIPKAPGEQHTHGSVVLSFRKIFVSIVFGQYAVPEAII